MPRLDEKDPLHEIAWKAWEEDQKFNPSAVNPHAFIYGFIQGYLTHQKENENSDSDKGKGARS